MKYPFKLVLLIFLSLIIVLLFSAYDNKTMHRSMNEAAYERFVKILAADRNFAHYQLSARQLIRGTAVTSHGAINITEKDRNFTIKDWIIHGGFSADEPEWLQALRHFYDPLAIDKGAHHLTDAIPPGITNPRIDIISWGLESKGEINHATSGIDGLSQHYSWKDGRESILKAIKLPESADRRKLMAHAWRCLGESLHCLGDLVCPVHVRNDGHPYSDPYEDAIRGKQYIPASPSSFWDPTLIAKVKATSDVASIYEMLAQNTNENFFSTQTIYGDGVKKIKPSIRTSNPYPKPYAKESGSGWKYDPIDFTYYKSINGHDIKMCKDRYYFADAVATNFRTEKAYVDLYIAKSQAQVLISNFIGVAPEVMKRYLPLIKVEIDPIREDRSYISGIVQISSVHGYPKGLSYESTVHLTNLTTGKSTKVEASKGGKFSTDELKFSEDDQVMAAINLGGLMIYSSKYKVAEPVDYPEIHLSGSVETLKKMSFSGGSESWLPAGKLTGEKVICSYTFAGKRYQKEVKTISDGVFAGSYSFMIPCAGYGSNPPFDIFIKVRDKTQKVVMDRNCDLEGPTSFQIKVAGKWQ